MQRQPVNVQAPLQPVIGVRVRVRVRVAPLQPVIGVSSSLAPPFVSDSIE